MTKTGLLRDHGLRALMLGLLATLLVAITPGAALASMTPLDVANMFGTDSGDAFSAVFLNQIFGPLFPLAGGSAGVTTVFSIIIGYFNVIVLVLGGMMFFYNVTVGIMQTAHEGSVLGQRWSSLWAPLRVVFAVGMLVPVPGLGGYNLAQAGVAYIVKGSTMVASAVWKTAANEIIDGTAPITVAQPQVSNDFVYTMFENVSCQAIENYYYAQASDDPIVVIFEPTTADDKVTYTSKRTNTMWSSQEGLCGTFTTPDLPIYISEVISTDNVVKGLTDAQKASIKTKFIQYNQKAVSDLYSDISGLVNSSAVMASLTDTTIEVPDLASDLIAARNRANATLSAGVDQILDMAIGTDRSGSESREALRTRINGSCADSADADSAPTCYGEGWIGAGSWYMMMAQLNNEMSSLTKAAPSAIAGDAIPDVSPDKASAFLSSGGTDYEAADIDDDVAPHAFMNEKLKAAYKNAALGMAALGETLDATQLNDLSNSTDENGLLSIIDIGAWHEAVEKIVSIIRPDNTSDPMISIINVGQWLLTAGAAISVVGTLAGATIAGTGLGSSITMLIVPIGGMLATCGLIMSKIMPIMPFMFWIFAVTGYFLLVVEAIVAVNLWALGHLRMDGEGISGDAGKYGWMMVLSLMMTPTLMLLGYLVGMIIFNITIQLINIGFYQAMVGLIGSNPIDAVLGGVIFGIAMVVFYLAAIERSFALVSEFPGRVLRWMGAEANLTKGDEDRVRGAALGAVAAIGRPLQNAWRLGGNKGAKIPGTGSITTTEGSAKLPPPSAAPNQGG